MNSEAVFHNPARVFRLGDLVPTFLLASYLLTLAASGLRNVGSGQFRGRSRLRVCLLGLLFRACGLARVSRLFRYRGLEPPEGDSCPGLSASPCSVIRTDASSRRTMVF